MTDKKVDKFIDINILKLWGKNPRSISTKGFTRLKKQIETLGQYKPLLINQDNIVLGGNMRLRAYRELGKTDVWVSQVETKTEEDMMAYALSDNDRAGFYDEDLLANLSGDYPDFEWGDYSIDLKEPTNLGELVDGIKDEDEYISTIDIKDIKDIKILNLYAGIGGNRALWGNAKVIAVEYNEQIAKVYKDYFPNDEIIIDDAHEYLEKNFEKFDFIWSSPPCPTHSRMRKNFGNNKPIYPDMALWQEVLFLQGYFKGKWVVENVKTWYDPLIESQEKGRHYYWSNFDIPNNDIFNETEIGMIDRIDNKMTKKFGFDLSKYSFSSEYPRYKILNNLVNPKAGEIILKAAFNLQ